MKPGEAEQATQIRELSQRVAFLTAQRDALRDVIGALDEEHYTRAFARVRPNVIAFAEAMQRAADDQLSEC